MVSSNLLVSSYLISQEYGKEVIKIEEVSPISDDDPCFSGTTEDKKGVYTSCGEGYRVIPYQITQNLVISPPYHLRFS